MGGASNHLHLTLGSTEGDEGRQAAHDIDEVAGQRTQLAPPPLGAVPRVQADQCAEDRDQREGEHDDQGGQRIGCEQGDEDDRRHQNGEQDGRQVARQVRLDLVDAVRGQKSRSARVDAGRVRFVGEVAEHPLPEIGGDGLGRTGGGAVGDA